MASAHGPFSYDITPHKHGYTVHISVERGGRFNKILFTVTPSTQPLFVLDTGEDYVKLGVSILGRELMQIRCPADSYDSMRMFIVEMTHVYDRILE